MTAEFIYKYAKACESLYGTNDPEKIFSERNVTVKLSPPSELRGFICRLNGALIVSVDVSLPESVKRMTLAHLLGHSLLHRKMISSGKAFEEGSLPKDIYDREADIFAAELLISDKIIADLRESGMSDARIVSSFGAIRELACSKLFSMRSRGVGTEDEARRADFLRRCDVELFY